MDAEIARFNEQKQRRERNLNELREQINSRMHLWSQSYHELKRLQKPDISQDAIERANAIADAFSRHAFIERVTFENGLMTVWTRLLFSDVRLSDGIRSTKRRCIGAFKIRSSIGAYGGIEVTNLLYPKIRYAHWAVKEGTPCLGEYSDNINQLRHDRDFYAYADTMIHYLRFSGDSAAWMRSHDWITKRLGGLPQLATGRAKAGSSLVMLRDDGVALKGTLHRVVRTYEGYPTIETLGHEITLEHGSYVLIKHSIFKNVDSLSDIERRYLAPLDALPDGSTLAEALELLP
jgi:hypothetical protein